jgi:hypothetical protein
MNMTLSATFVSKKITPGLGVAPKIEPDNWMRLFGILLTNNNIRDYCANLTGDVKSGGRRIDVVRRIQTRQMK